MLVFFQQHIQMGMIQNNPSKQSSFMYATKLKYMLYVCGSTGAPKEASKCSILVLPGLATSFQGLLELLQLLFEFNLSTCGRCSCMTGRRTESWLNSWQSLRCLDDPTPQFFEELRRATCMEFTPDLIPPRNLDAPKKEVCQVIRTRQKKLQTVPFAVSIS